MENPIIETERMLLVTETEDDFDAIYNIVAQLYPPEYPPERDGLRDEQRFYMLMRAGMFRRVFGRWFLKLKSSGEWIGVVMLIPHFCTPVETEALGGPAHRSLEAEAGWALIPSYRRQGYGSEASRALIDFALKTADLGRVIAITDTNNPQSIELMRRLGMTIMMLPEEEVMGVLSA